MAKRKRLSPMPIAAPPMPPESPAPAIARRSAPIADVSKEAAGHAAAAEMAAALEAARSEGRMVVVLPLDAIAEGYLVRDRIPPGDGDDEDMAALKASLRARGQQVPVEVTPTAPEAYGLISGWRRLSALRALHAETGEPRFAGIRAVIRQPEDIAAAYLAMVEENEIRAALSYYERARIVARAAEAGVFPDARTALRSLFASASRPRRSKIGSFGTIVAALDGVLRFPRAIGERLGLRLARALEEDPDLGARLRTELLSDPPGSAEAELARLDGALDTPAGGVSRAKRPDPSLGRFGVPMQTGGGNGPASSRRAPSVPEDDANHFARETAEPVPGIQMALDRGRLTLTGDGVDADLAARLAAWLRAGV